MSHERWVWGVEIPWLPDLLADGSDSSVGQSPLLEAFGRQVAFLKAVASTSAGEAFQVRYMTGDERDRPVRVFVLGRARSAGYSSDAAALVMAGLPGEYPTRPLGQDELPLVLDPFGGDPVTRSTFVEVRRAVEPLFVEADPQDTADRVVLPWTWAVQSLLSSIEVLRRQPGRSLLAVHVEARRPTVGLTSWLAGEVNRFQLLAKDNENPLVLTAIVAYRRWLRDLPNEALHLRMFLASDEALMPGAAELIGTDLTRSWEAHGGPSALAGSFSVVVPETRGDQARAQLLIDELVSIPYDTPADPVLAELQMLFGAHEANAAFRLPITPRGGLEGVATARLTALPSGRQGRDAIDTSPAVTLGTRAGGGDVRITTRELNQHLLVAGLPGFGKTTTMHSILLGLQGLPEPVPFLVIDPSKNDYRHVIAALSGQEPPRSSDLVHLDPKHVAFNPLAPPDGVDVHRHAGRVLAAFDAVLGLSNPTKAGYLYFARALYTCYEEAAAEGRWPSLSDLHRSITLLLRRSKMTAENSADWEAALLGRIEFLVGGPTGVALVGGPDAGIDWDDLMSRPTVIELGAFTGEERSLVFALVLAGLVSWRETHPRPGLSHVTVLEEAHRVLSARGDSLGVDMFVEAIAELRGSGEGFVVVEQAPSSLHPGVPKLTGSRIAHRIVEADERALLSSSMMLDTRQSEELGRLASGRAVIHTAGAAFPVLAEIRPSTDTSEALPDVPIRWSLSRPGSRPLSLACMGCPQPCTGREGAVLAQRLVETAHGTGPEAAAALVDAAYSVTAARPNGVMAAYCAAAHALAERDHTSVAVLSRSLRLAAIRASQLIKNATPTTPGS